MDSFNASNLNFNDDTLLNRTRMLLGEIGNQSLIRTPNAQQHSKSAYLANQSTMSSRFGAVQANEFDSSRLNFTQTFEDQQSKNTDSHHFLTNTDWFTFYAKYIYLLRRIAEQHFHRIQIEIGWNVGSERQFQGSFKELRGDLRRTSQFHTRSTQQLQRGLSETSTVRSSLLFF